MVRDKQAVTAPLAIHELELALLREQLARREWKLAAAAEELALMRRIRRTAQWSDDLEPLLEPLDTALAEALHTVERKDTTRIQAAHTRLEKAIFALRDRLYA